MASTLPFLPADAEHLDISALETWLWDAACAIRGSTDTPKFKDFSTDLLALPKSLGEFVSVPELVHLLVANHGRVFKLFMHAYLPDWEERKQRLCSVDFQLA